MTSEKLHQTDDLAVLDGIKLTEFHLLVDSLSEWISSGIVKIRFSPNANIEFDDSKILPLLKERNLPDNCVPLMKFDISLMLSGILTGSRGMIIGFLVDNANVRQPRGVKPPTEKQIKATTTDRLNYVEQKIVTSDLRKQYAIKNKSKTNLYFGTAWEVVRSQSEDDPTVPVGLVYATLRIDTYKPSLMRNQASFPIAFQALRPGEYDSTVFTMTLQDLTDFIDSLNSAAKAIKQSIDSEGKS